MNVPLVFSIAFILGFAGGIIGGMTSSSFGNSGYVTQAEFQNFTEIQNQTHINIATALAERDLAMQNATLQYVLDNWVIQVPP